jgi:hypothetical protein
VTLSYFNSARGIFLSGLIFCKAMQIPPEAPAMMIEPDLGEA